MPWPLVDLPARQALVMMAKPNEYCAIHMLEKPPQEGKERTPGPKDPLKETAAPPPRGNKKKKKKKKKT